MEPPNSVQKRLLLPLGLSVAGALLAAWLVPKECNAVAEQLLGFPDSDVIAHQLRPVILGAVLPPRRRRTRICSRQHA